ncbi:MULTISPECIES: PaaI family thioesterase [unclassified Legionella]|uniref:PaaI family thioesterase n=1 Tax=unclassified Legionella TaxID=2622702 RepID=UPI001056952C|nr:MULTISPECIES: DUF4442 domain-containing protein [unclassified Legionella]MDI9818745.1 DUF4442 domain-containing protein [Legionella sp. PL877]
MSPLTRFKFFLCYFGHFKVPLIGHLKPKLIKLNEREIVAKIPLRRRSKNHLNSMYFGALAIGADLAGGLHSFYHAERAKLNVSVAFKSFQAQFIRRPETDVYFICEQGEQVRAMIEESKQTGQRVNSPIAIRALINYPENPEEIANFSLELSVKVI